MRITLLGVIVFAVVIILTLLGVYLTILVIKALRKYIKSKDVRQEKQKIAKSLGQVLKEHRTRCKMTQEFVAEQLGISRQVVSKWESGVSDPNTTNLIALAKLYGVAPEELLKETYN
ncbi:MAG: helix-turn-helix domain-containing protein [Erysipelotrichaceae bacterium]|jgi:DNA-binding XRE family transcriptional regulator